MRTAIGSRVRCFRKGLGLSPDDAAAEAGVPAGRRESIESGSITATTGDVLRMSAVLGVPFSTLIGPPLAPDGSVAVQSVAGRATSDPADVQAVIAQLDALADVSEQLSASGYHR